MKYKLVKEYPNSPSKGIIAEWDENDKGYWYRSYRNGFLSTEEIQKFPENWAPCMFTTEDGGRLTIEHGYRRSLRHITSGITLGCLQQEENFDVAKDGKSKVKSGLRKVTCSTKTRNGFTE